MPQQPANRKPHSPQSGTHHSRRTSRCIRPTSSMPGPRVLPRPRLGTLQRLEAMLQVLGDGAQHGIDLARAVANDAADLAQLAHAAESADVGHALDFSVPASRDAEAGDHSTADAGGVVAPIAPVLAVDVVGLGENAHDPWGTWMGGRIRLRMCGV